MVEKTDRRVRAREHRCASSREKQNGARLRGFAPKIPSYTSLFGKLKARLTASFPAAEKPRVISEGRGPPIFIANPAYTPSGSTALRSKEQPVDKVPSPKKHPYPAKPFFVTQRKKTRLLILSRYRLKINLRGTKLRRFCEPFL